MVTIARSIKLCGSVIPGNSQKYLVSQLVLNPLLMANFLAMVTQMEPIFGQREPPPLAGWMVCGQGTLFRCIPVP